MALLPDALLEVRFFETTEGGRRTAIVGETYSCPMRIDGKYYDCRLILEGKVLQLGNTYEVAVKFLDRDLALSKLRMGKKIVLWEGKDVAVGKVIEIL